MATAILESTETQVCPALVLARFEQRSGLSRADSLAVWSELLKFLTLRTETERSLAPSRIVDEMWHEVILHTRDYAALCEALVGTFIHHNPHERPDALAYERTLLALRHRFGDVRSDYWPAMMEQAGTCGSCD